MITDKDNNETPLDHFSNNRDFIFGKRRKLKDNKQPRKRASAGRHFLAHHSKWTILISSGPFSTQRFCFFMKYLNNETIT